MNAWSSCSFMLICTVNTHGKDTQQTHRHQYKISPRTTKWALLSREALTLSILFLNMRHECVGVDVSAQRATAHKKKESTTPVSKWCKCVSKVAPGQNMPHSREKTTRKNSLFMRAPRKGAICIRHWRGSSK
ncbi:MAG: hypothetical protein BYD32DRAFT_416850 [Podila humilis]|nr:MAG: hypothetical protein BYD32DRAFT_416850 [Podila humilis]